MSNSVIIKRHSSAILVTDIQTASYKAIDLMRNRPVYISDIGSVFPLEIASKVPKYYKYERIKTLQPSKQSKDEQFRKVKDFFRNFNKYKKKGVYTLQVKTIFKTETLLFVNIPEGYPKVAPRVDIPMYIFSSYPYYDPCATEFVSYTDDEWEKTDLLMNFICEAIICINQIEFKALFGKWIGTKLKHTQVLE